MRSHSRRRGAPYLATVSAIALSMSAAGTSPALAQAIITNGNRVSVPSAGQSSPWTIPGDGNLTIGRASTGIGIGHLDIYAGGVVESRNATLNGINGAASTATVGGAGGRWSNAELLTIGAAGEATLTVRDGGRAESSGGWIGHYEGSNGIVSVTGVGSTLAIADQLRIGIWGRGTVTIEAGGRLESRSSSIGVGRDSTDALAIGTVTVTGAGSIWVNTQTVNVGEQGKGTLNVEAGGRVETEYMTLGLFARSEGTLNVRGSGSTVVASAGINVGHGGRGELNIEAGGRVEASYVNVGNDFSGMVRVTGAGSLLKVAESLGLGADGGHAALIVADGGRVENRYGYISNGAGGASVLVTGRDSAWVNSRFLHIGYDNAAELKIADGGRVEVNGVNDATSLGSLAGGAGTVVVTGTGSTLAIVNQLQVGSTGTGRLVISDGGMVESREAIVGAFNNTTSTENGTVLVEGAGSRWTNHGVLIVGDGGHGRMTIASGGRVDSQGGWLGFRRGSSGAVTVTGAGSVWAGSNDLTIGNSGTGTLTIAEQGTVSVADGAGSVRLAFQASGVGRLNIGAAEGDAPAAAGVINAKRIVFGAGTSSLVFNHSGAISFSAALMDTDVATPGARTIRHMAGFTDYTGDGSRFGGDTVVSGGTLGVSGMLGGTLDVLAAGRLQGTGTVGATTVSGTIAPGNSIGTLTVAGSILFNPSSIYEVEVNAAGQGDRIHATGTATISGGTVKVLAGAGSYALSTRYTILTADGGRSGTFGGVTANFAFLTPSLSYDADSVYLTLARNQVTFGNVGTTRNQIATGGGVESLGSGHAIWDAVVQLDAPAARRAFDQLSGEIHASARTALIEDSRFLRDAATDRVRAAFGAVGASTMPVMAYAEGGPRPGPANTERLAVWGQGFGAWGQTGGDGNAARLTRSTGGFLMGADAPIFETWRLGAVAGYSHTGFNARDRASSGSSDNYHLGLYGGTQSGPLGLRAGLAYTWHAITTGRVVALPGAGDGPKASYNAGTVQAFGDLGYRIDTAIAAFEPFANLAHVSLASDGFSERGAAAALHGNGGTTSATFSTLGLRASTTFALAGIRTTARGSLGWRHAFGTVTPGSTHSFATGDAFTIWGVPIARNAAVVEAGLDMAITPAATLGLSYGGQFGSGATTQNIRGNLAIRF